MTATPVAPLSRSVQASCTVDSDFDCTTPASWQVGTSQRSCDGHLALVLRAARASGDGFAPTLVLPIGRAR